MKGLPLEFGIGVRGPKCLNDGSTRRSKKFSDRFSRFDTIRLWPTDTQPASHVAVAITLYAIASSPKIGRGFGLARCGLGLAGLMLCCETRSCYARHHNDLEGLVNFSVILQIFLLLLLLLLLLLFIVSLFCAWNITTGCLSIMSVRYGWTVHLAERSKQVTKWHSTTFKPHFRVKCLRRWLQLRFDFDSLRFDRATTIRRLRHDRTPTCVRGLLRCGLDKLWHDHGWRVTLHVNLVTFDKQSNGVGSKSVIVGSKETNCWPTVRLLPDYWDFLLGWQWILVLGSGFDLANLTSSLCLACYTKAESSLQYAQWFLLLQSCMQVTNGERRKNQRVPQRCLWVNCQVCWKENDCRL